MSKVLGCIKKKLANISKIGQYKKEENLA